MFRENKFNIFHFNRLNMNLFNKTNTNVETIKRQLIKLKRSYEHMDLVFLEKQDPILLLNFNLLFLKLV